MTHSYSSLYYHIVWSTKNREPYIDADVKNRLYGYFRATIDDKKQKLIIMNGMPDHVHLLLSLSVTTLLPEFIKHLKTSSTKWMRSEPLLLREFSWQEGYAAFTVGYSNLQQVIKYIENQEQHHQNQSFEEEYLGFLNKQNISYDQRFVLG